MASVTLKEVAAMMAYKGKPMTLEAVRYRIKKSNKRGDTSITLGLALDDKGQKVQAITRNEAVKLCNLWKNLHR